MAAAAEQPAGPGTAHTGAPGQQVEDGVQHRSIRPAADPMIDSWVLASGVFRRTRTSVGDRQARSWTANGTVSVPAYISRAPVAPETRPSNSCSIRLTNSSSPVGRRTAAIS